MFVDAVSISVHAGKGGDGAVHFRKEKFIPKGGPDGGDGGNGGNIIFEAAHNLHTLSQFRSQKVFRAENGKPGSIKNMTGRMGENLIIKVPVGTQVRKKDSDKIWFDLVQEGQKVMIAQGGVGGKGNAGFVSSVRQAPSFAEKGDIGNSFDLDLELKLVADVALVGLPSSGKSTFISVISNARPKIAEYHFTTLVPHLGVANVKKQEVIFVDVPGLIEGASEGKGLGHTFLKHIERASFVLHCIEADSETPLADFKVIRQELQKFSPRLEQKPFFPVFTKIDLVDEAWLAFLVKEFEAKFDRKPFFVSAATHENMEVLLKKVLFEVETINQSREASETLAREKLEAEEKIRETEAQKNRHRSDQAQTHVQITPMENWWELKNNRLEQMVRQTDMDHNEAKERIYDVLKKWGTIQNMHKMGALPGAKIKIGIHFLIYRGI